MLLCDIQASLLHASTPIAILQQREHRGSQGLHITRGVDNRILSRPCQNGIANATDAFSHDQCQARRRSLCRNQSIRLVDGRKYKSLRFLE